MGYTTAFVHLFCYNVTDIKSLPLHKWKLQRLHFHNHIVILVETFSCMKSITLYRLNIDSEWLLFSNCTRCFLHKLRISSNAVADLVLLFIPSQNPKSIQGRFVSSCCSVCHKNFVVIVKFMNLQQFLFHSWRFVAHRKHCCNRIAVVDLWMGIGFDLVHITISFFLSFLGTIVDARQILEVSVFLGSFSLVFV